MTWYSWLAIVLAVLASILAILVKIDERRQRRGGEVTLNDRVSKEEKYGS